MKNNRLSILLIVSALIIASAVIGIFLSKQRATKLEFIRTQGTGITRSLSMLPLDVFSSENQREGVLRSLLVFYDQHNFAYAVMTSQDGRILGDVAKPGVSVPNVAAPTTGASLFGERIVVSPVSQKQFREFYGPIMPKGEILGYLRIGYLEPEYVPGGQELSFLASIALLTFLLVPLIYLLLRKEMTPLKNAAQRLEQMLSAQSGSADVALRKTDFVNNLSSYIDDAHKRIAAIESEKASMLTTQRLLEYNCNKMTFLLQSLPDGIILLDPSGELTFASAKVKPLIGVDSQDMLSDPISSWCTNNSLSELLTRLRSQPASKARPETIEFHPEHAPEKRIRVTAQPLLPPQEEIAFGTLLIVHDASREFVLEQAGHDFVAQVSHELKSPLNTVALYAELLQNDAGQNQETGVEAVNVISDEVERMSALVNNLLNISKMESGGLQPRRSRVKLDEFLRDVYDNLAPQAKSKQIEIELAIATDIDGVLLDKDIFRIALNNLVTNAIKYTNTGGKISLQVSDTAKEVQISVRDTGIGIAPEEQAHVFKKFFRAGGNQAQVRQGHGLGLYLAAMIVQLHHGRITLESEPGRGSTFSICLKKTNVLNQEMNAL